MRAAVWTLVVAAALNLASCASRQPVRGQEVTGLDRKLSTFIWFEKGDLVELVVGTKATRLREDTPYIPFEVAVVNRGLRQLTVSRESFVLIDENGNRYPCANPTELRDNYEFLVWDRTEFMEIASVTTTRYAAYVQYPSLFSPVPTSRRVVRDFVALPRFGYFIDMIYFPKPETPIRDHRYELFLQAPELPDPVFVKLEVR